MKQKTVFGACALLLALESTFAGCSSSDRTPIVDVPPPAFTTEGGAGCDLSCSSDLLSIVDCKGAAFQTCPAGTGCSENKCIPACDAAAAAKGSAGCDFYALPPPMRFIESRNCFAAYLVNHGNAPVDLGVELAGHELDTSGAVYTYREGTTVLAPIDGPIPVGVQAVVFLSDGTPPVPMETPPSRCPLGVKAASPDWPIPGTSGLGDAFHLTASAPLSIATIYPYGGADSHFPTATMLLPTAGWGRQHVVVTPWERADDSFLNSPADPLFGNPAVQIVAAEDNTDVTIRPSVDLGEVPPDFAGAKKSVPQTYHLARGQALQILQPEDIVGSLVESTKPTSVFSGQSCMFIPSTKGYCDAAQQQQPSFAQWGNEYALVRYRSRHTKEESAPYRIVAAFDGTQLTYDPAPPDGAPITMSGGQVVTFWTTDPFVVRSQDLDHPFHVLAYMSGSVWASEHFRTADEDESTRFAGDPEAVNVVSAGQYQQFSSFYADPTYEETSLVIVRRKSRGGETDPGMFSAVTLDCAGPPLPTFTPIGTGGDFEFARVDLSHRGYPANSPNAGHACGYGVHTISSRAPFTATIWGWSDAASYAYPGGMAQRSLVTRPLVVR